MGFLSKLFGNEKTNAAEAATPVTEAALDVTDEYFDELINADTFPGYTVERKVNVSRFDSSAHPSCFAISYLFSREEKPVLAVFIMKKNQYRSMIARGAYKVLEDNNIKYIRFFREMENEKGYVIDRIRSELND